MLLLLHGLGPCPPQTHAPGVLSLGPGAASLGSMAPAHLAKQGPGAAAQPASTAQARKDTATQRKDLRKQSVSTVRLQNRDGLSRASASDGLELQKQDLTSRCVPCVREEAARPLPSRPVMGARPAPTEATRTDCLKQSCFEPVAGSAGLGRPQTHLDPGATCRALHTWA